MPLPADAVATPLEELRGQMASGPIYEGQSASMDVMDEIDPATLPKGKAVEISRESPIERDDSDPDESVKQEVKEWWQRTGDTLEWERFTRQIQRDTATVFGEDLGSQEIDEQAETEDRAKVMTRHIYRNAVQSMALVLPQDPIVAIETDRQMPLFDLGTGIQNPDSDGVNPKDVAFAAALDLAQQKLCKKANAMQNLRGFIQDGHHYEVAWIQATWQRNYRTDSINRERLNDAQDTAAELQALTDAYDRDEFTDQDADYKRMGDLAKALTEETELPVQEGLMIKSHPPHLVRHDPNVKRIEDWRECEWISIDYLKSRREILKRWRKVDPDDLAMAAVYGPDGKRQGIETREMEKVARQKPEGVQLASDGIGSNRQRSISDWDSHLVRIVESKRDQRVYVLIEGLDYYADDYTPKDRPEDWYEIEPFVLNRPPGNMRMEGLSDSELQAKEQDRLNRIDTDEDEDCRAARTHGIFNKDVIEDWDGKGFMTLKAHEWLGVSFGDKNMQEGFLPIPGQQLHPEIHSVRRATAMSNLRSMSGIPEQMTGAVGNPKFAEQVKVSDKGAAVLMQLRMGIINGLLESVWRRICHLIVTNASTEFMVMLIGENVRTVWDAAPKNRMEILQRLKITVSASDAGKAGQEETIKGLELMNTIDSTPQAPGSMIDKQKLLEAVARTIKLPMDIDAMIKPSANDLGMRLASVMAKDPASIDPAILQQLAQVLMPRIQEDIRKNAQAMQQTGAPSGQPSQGAASGGHGPGQGMPPSPSLSQPPQGIPMPAQPQVPQ